LLIPKEPGRLGYWGGEVFTLFAPYCNKEMINKEMIRVA